MGHGDRLARLLVGLPIAVAFVCASCAGGGDEKEAAPPSRPPARLHVEELAQIPFRGELGQTAAGFGSLWVVSVDDHLVRISPESNRVVARIKMPNGAFIGIGGDSVWYADYYGDRVLRIDPAKNKVVAAFDTGSRPEGIIAAGGAVWVANHHGGSVTRIDPKTNKVATVEVGQAGSSGPQAVATNGRTVWVGVPNLSAVVGIDPAKNRTIAKIALPPEVQPCGGLAADERSVWVSGGGCTGAIAQIDVATKRVRRVLFKGQAFSYPPEVHDPIVARDAVWLTKPAENKTVLYKIDAETGDVIGRATLAGGRGLLAFAFGSAWLFDGETSRIVRADIK